MTSHLAPGAQRGVLPRAWRADERATAPVEPPLLQGADQVAALRRQLEQRDVLLATAAHELRNCLAPMSNAVELLARAAETSTRAVAASLARRQVKIMSALVQDLMDYGRLASPAAKDRTRLMLQQVLQDALEACRAALDEREHQARIELPPRPLWIDADATQLSQVFANLLNNAIKFTPRGGAIALSAVRAGNMAEVRLTDSGVGIAAADLERIFDLFQQDRSHRHLAPGGLGIGLAVVRRLLELHGGDVRATSPGPDCGSSFIVRLPLARE